VSEVITLGECMASFVALERGPLAEAVSWRRTVAGAEANVAVGLARLGHSVAFVGRVGADGLGTAIVRQLRGEGVEVSHLRTDPDATTGVMLRSLRDLGAAEVVYWRSGSAGSRVAPDDVDAAGAAFAGARWLHLTGITPALSPSARAAVERALGRAREARARVSLDLNLRRRLWSEAEATRVLAVLAGRVDVVLGGLEEAAVVAGLAATLEAGSQADEEAVALAVLALGPSSAVIRLGARGALEAHRDAGELVVRRRPALDVPLVADPVGAGDAFTAGYLAALLDGRPVEEALAAANACAASTIVSVGDQAGLPDGEELARLLRAGGPDVLR
jgi:2-dehydro-3-deoxygluconokinase